jgi:hypothetical protein
MVSKETPMSDLKRNMDFAAGNSAAMGSPNTAGIAESQPWRTTDMQQAMDLWSAEAGFDPYNHVGTRAKKPYAA